MCRPGRPERHRRAIGQQHVAHGQHALGIDGRGRRGGGTHDHVAVQAQWLLNVLTLVRMVPVDPGVGESHPVRECIARRDGTLRDPDRPVRRAVQPDAVPMDRRGQVRRIAELDDDRGTLRHVDQWSRYLAVVCVGGERSTGHRATDPQRGQRECVARTQSDDLTRTRRCQWRITRGGEEWRDIGLHVRHRAGRHSRHRRRHHRRRQKGRHGVTVCQHAAVRRRPAKHERAGANGVFGRRLGCDQNTKVIASGLAEHGPPVMHRPKPDGAIESDRRHPRDVCRRSMSGIRRPREPRDRNHDFISGIPISRHRDIERRRDGLQLQHRGGPIVLRRRHELGAIVDTRGADPGGVRTAAAMHGRREP